MRPNDKPGTPQIGATFKSQQAPSRSEKLQNGFPKKITVLKIIHAVPLEHTKGFF